MPISTAAITVTTTATLLATGRGGDDPIEVIVKDASGTFYLGGADVTSSSGTAFTTTDVLTMSLGPGDALYGITSTGTQTVRVFKTRQ